MSRKTKSIPSPRHSMGAKAAEMTLLLSHGVCGHGSKEGLKENTTKKLELKRQQKIIKSHHQERIQWTAGMLLLCKITIKLRLMSFPTNYPQSVGRHTKRFHFTHSNSFPYLGVSAIDTDTRLLTFFFFFEVTATQRHLSRFCQRGAPLGGRP